MLPTLAIIDRLLKIWARDGIGPLLLVELEPVTLGMARNAMLAFKSMVD